MWLGKTVSTFAIGATAALSLGALAANQGLNYFDDADDLKPRISGLADVSHLRGYKQAFCDRSVDDLFRDKLAPFLSEKNPPGPLGWGLCWLHTLFQRRAAYLVNFRPELERPSAAAAARLIRKISVGTHVVEIPGFRNLNDFSKAHWNLIEYELTLMGARMMANGQVARRVTDKPSMKASKLAKQMDRLHLDLAQSPRVMYARVKADWHTPVVMSHAFLILKVEPIGGDVTPLNGFIRNADGYRVSLIDSNFPDQIRTAEYKRGETSLKYCTEDETLDGSPVSCDRIILYPDFEEEVFGLERAVAKYCR